MKQAGESGRDC